MSTASAPAIPRFLASIQTTVQRNFSQGPILVTLTHRKSGETEVSHRLHQPLCPPLLNGFLISSTVNTHSGK